MRRNAIDWSAFLARILPAIIVVIAFSACDKSTPTGPSSPTPDVPIVVKEESGTVKVYAVINATYLDSSSWHAVTFKDMTNGDLAIFKSFAEPLDLYDGLVAIGGEPGNNMDPALPDSVMDTLHVQGDIIEILIDWEGAPETYTLSEVVDDSTGYGIEMRFGGNRDTQQAWETGCLSCWVSCPAGITSNAKYNRLDFQEGRVNIKGRKDILPSNGTPVVLTYKLGQ